MTAVDCFLDANILLRHITNDHLKLSPKAKIIIHTVATKRIRAHITTLVIHEVVYVLRYGYKVEKAVVSRYLSALLSLPNLIIIDCDKQVVLQALNDYQNYSLDFPDCVYAHLTKEKNLKLLSFDRDFKKLGIEAKDKI